MSDIVSPAIASEPAYLELTFKRAINIWWAYFWRHMVYGGTAVLIISFLEGLAGLGKSHLLLSVSVVVVMGAMSMLVLAIVLHKQFHHFSIRLVASPR
jgi:hypothetical protein